MCLDPGERWEGGNFITLKLSFYSEHIQTYNGPWRKYGRVKTDTDWTFGGYTGQHTVPEKWTNN